MQRAPRLGHRDAAFQLVVLQAARLAALSPATEPARRPCGAGCQSGGSWMKQEPSSTTAGPQKQSDARCQLAHLQDERHQPGAVPEGVGGLASELGAAEEDVRQLRVAALAQHLRGRAGRGARRGLARAARPSPCTGVLARSCLQSKAAVPVCIRSAAEVPVGASTPHRRLA